MSDKSKERSCHKKRAYETRTKAQNALDWRESRARRVPELHAEWLRDGYQFAAVYECVFCHCFHIGRQAKCKHDWTDYAPSRNGQNVVRECRQCGKKEGIICYGDTASYLKPQAPPHPDGGSDA